MAEMTDRKPSGCLKTVRVVLALLLILLLPLTYLTFNIGRVIFNPTIVKRVASDVIVKSRLVVAGLEWFSEWRAQNRVDTGLARPNEDEPDVVQMIEFIDAEGWQQIREEVLPDEFLISWSNAAIDGAYAWIDSQDTLPQITLDMADFKRLVSGEHGDNAVMVAYHALPTPCTQEQIDDFLFRLSQVPIGVEVLYNLCQFPDPWREDQIGDFHDSLGDVVEGIPDEFALVERLNEDGVWLIPGVPPHTVKSVLRITRAVTRWSLVLPLIVIGLLVLAAPRSREGISYWLGVPLTLGGLLALILGVTYRWLVTRIVISIPLRAVTPLLLQEATAAALRLAAEIFGVLLIMAIVTVVAGGALIAVAATSREEEPGEEKEDRTDLSGDAPITPPEAGAAG